MVFAHFTKESGRTISEKFCPLGEPVKLPGVRTLLTGTPIPDVGFQARSEIKASSFHRAPVRTISISVADLAGCRGTGRRGLRRWSGGHDPGTHGTPCGHLHDLSGRDYDSCAHSCFNPHAGSYLDAHTYLHDKREGNPERNHWFRHSTYRHPNTRADANPSTDVHAPTDGYRYPLADNPTCGHRYRLADAPTCGHRYPLADTPTYGHHTAHTEPNPSTVVNSGPVANT